MNDTTLLESEEAVALSQLQELRMLSPQLADFAQRLQLKVKKMEAVQDFAEQHEDKYARLFTAVVYSDMPASHTDGLEGQSMQSETHPISFP